MNASFLPARESKQVEEVTSITLQLLTCLTFLLCGIWKKKKKKHGSLSPISYHRALQSEPNIRQGTFHFKCIRILPPSLPPSLVSVVYKPAILPHSNDKADESALGAERAPDSPSIFSATCLRSMLAIIYRLLSLRLGATDSLGQKRGAFDLKIHTVAAFEAGEKKKKFKSFPMF